MPTTKTMQAIAIRKLVEAAGKHLDRFTIAAKVTQSPAKPYIGVFAFRRRVERGTRNREIQFEPGPHAIRPGRRAQRLPGECFVVGREYLADGHERHKKEQGQEKSVAHDPGL